MKLDVGDRSTRELIQRWIGAPQTGDLNEKATVRELLRTVWGLASYLQERAAIDQPAPRVPEAKAPGKFKDFQHSTSNMGGNLHPKGVVFHHTAGSFQGALSWVQQRESGVSYNLIIHPDGSRHHIVPLDRVAWHAGRSKFRGRTRCNDFMVGIAFSGSTYDRKLTSEEIASASEFVSLHANKYGWSLEWMTDHRTVAPSRRNDLNPVEFARLMNALKSVFP